MSELMDDIRAEPKPGTALRTVVKEHHHLDEFMAMVRAKMALDEKYLTELKTLRDSWNPEWNESGVWPLISPLLKHIGNEVDERERAVTELNSRFAAFSDALHPNPTHEDCFEMLESIEIRYRQYEQCHKVSRKPESISELRRWRHHVDSSDPGGYPLNWALPTHERGYRRAVVAQQTAVKNTLKWQADTLPVVLERHQQCTEEVKSFLNVLFTNYSAIYSGLSMSCSTALSSNRVFSSSKFIAPRHDEAEMETSHVLLQAVDYRNYMQSREVTQPMFGLGVEKTVSLINELLNYGPTMAADLPKYGTWVFSAFELEAATRLQQSEVLRSSSPEGGEWIQRVIAHCSPASYFVHNMVYILCAFLMDEPLLPLPGDVITQYPNGISRAKLSSLMATHLPFARQEVVTLIARVADMLIAQNPTGSREDIWRRMGTYLSHNYAAAPIMESIWRKWNIRNDRPLPEGVERVWRGHDMKSKVVWKKSGAPYLASHQ